MMVLNSSVYDVITGRGLNKVPPQTLTCLMLIAGALSQYPPKNLTTVT